LSENYLNKTFEIGRFHILRLPIFWGENDHTKRLEFYVSRLLDNQPVILINNGNNYCQISNVCELAVNICRFIQEGKLIDQPILEALPSEKESLSGIINIISKAVLSSSELIGFNEVELQKSFSKYLINEPLWREREIQITDNNIFRALNVKTTLPKYWLSKLSIIEAKKKPLTDMLRKDEIIFLKNSRH
jgi:nucleoside-diphosphate-sugar epimerase